MDRNAKTILCCHVGEKISVLREARVVIHAIRVFQIEIEPYLSANICEFDLGFGVEVCFGSLGGHFDITSVETLGRFFTNFTMSSAPRRLNCVSDNIAKTRFELYMDKRSWDLVLERQLFDTLFSIQYKKGSRSAIT